MCATRKKRNALIGLPPMSLIWLLSVAVLSFSTSLARASTHCEQKWDDIKAPHFVADTYRIHLLKVNTTEEHQSFMPSTRYQVLLKSDEDGVKFTRFYLTVDNEDRTLPHGLLELYDDEITQFSQDCPDSVVQTSQVLKDEVSAYWISPEEGSGCVVFRASVMESPSRWFMDGSLEQKFCQDPKATIDDPGPVLPECCACDEAKYELAFEGLWSRYTHPKDFPSKPWNARFSDVIGASHTSEYRFWEYGAMASEGLKQVAENSVTRALESELKNQSIHIRTIIKARGITFPNITSKTFAVFRVDQQHHLVSLVSMIDPSPDWFVGVSGLELCLVNCSWVEHKELNLYPIDAGTDDGITYEAVDVKTEPQDVIRRITTTWPADERSPFYDVTAIDMNPLAKLYLKRQRVYEKNCDSTTMIDNIEEACRVTQWGPWSSCSVTCGRGSRQRQRNYKNERSAIKHKCDSDLVDTAICFGSTMFSECSNAEPDSEKCPLTKWSRWSLCSKMCGPEPKTRERNYRGSKKQRKQCRHLFPDVKLQETIDCGNPDCGDEGPGGDSMPEGAVSSNTKCVNERYTQWSFWSPCSVTCGMGTKSRSRQIRPNWVEESESRDKDLSLYECQYESTTCVADTISCDISKEMMEVICSQPLQPGQCPDDHSDNSLRYYYDKSSSRCDIFHYTGCNGNMNNFRTQQECQDTCLKFQGENKNEEEEQEASTEGGGGGRKKKKKKHRNKETKSSYEDKVHCKVSDWSDWSPCYSCKGYRTMNREILTHPRNGGKPCPTKMIRKQKCHKVLPECDSQNERKSTNKRNGDRDESEEEDDDDEDEEEEEEDQVVQHCRVSQWSQWSSCSSTCGPSQRWRKRNVAVAAKGRKARARPCPALTEYEACRLPAC